MNTVDDNQQAVLSTPELQRHDFLIFIFIYL
jgi:hypothetical protein